MSYATVCAPVTLKECYYASNSGGSCADPRNDGSPRCCQPRLALLQRCLATGEPGEIDLELSRTGLPSSKWIELSVNPIGPTVLQGVLNDITERKRT
jgi:hypothetical protein